MRSLYRRKFCLTCSPFGHHNTSKQPLGRSAEAIVAKRRRRAESWLSYLRKRRRTRKNMLLALRGGRCEDCGYSTSVAALEFHHRDATTKDFGVGNFNGSWQRLLDEAEKCDLLCANCHRRRHALVFAGRIEERLSLVGPAKKARAIAYMGGACSGCGEVSVPALLEFHHRDAKEKEFGISRDGMARSWDAIVGELAKCVMFCANCHREVHAGVRSITPANEVPAEPRARSAA